MSVPIGVRKQHPTIVLILLSGLGAPPALAADDAAAGRHHAAKANRLAAKNDCAGAVMSFTRAYKLLHDPTLLFNRAECYRKLGKDKEALRDYEQFLAELPDAPNRASVEARIVVLRSAAAEESQPASPPAAESRAPANDTAKAKPKAAEPPRAEKWTD